MRELNKKNQGLHVTLETITVRFATF